MRQNPYIKGDTQSRDDNWTLTEGVIVDLEETENYILYQVDTDYNDTIWCKQSMSFGGSGSCFVAPLQLQDRVIVGFMNSSPENNIYILGCVQTPERLAEELTDEIKAKLIDYEKKLSDLTISSNADQSFVLNIKNNIHMIAMNTFNLIGNKFNLLSSDNMIIKSDKEISVEGTTKAILKAPQVEIGANPSQSAIQGDNLYTLLSTLISSLPSVSLMPNPGYSATITTLNAQLAQIKSATVKVSP